MNKKDIDKGYILILFILYMIPLVQIAYKSEWALAKFFQALKEFDIPEKYILAAICGREENKQRALDALIKSIHKRVELLDNPKFRTGNRKKEIQSALTLVKRLFDGTIDYYQVNGGQTLPEEIYERVSASVIHSKNTTHLGYILDAIEHGKHVLCEKPIVTVLDGRGRANKEDLNELEQIVASASPELVLMDAEHYSYKKAAIIFYENLDSILTDKHGKKRKIRSIEGCIKEIDDPEFGRTKDILNLQNETGLLTDTGCHLLAFISNLGGVAKPISATYGIYPSYNVETYFDVENRVTGKDFTDDATASIKGAKFIDKLKINKSKPKEITESKYIKFTLDDNSEIIVNLKEGNVIKKEGGEERVYASRNILTNNEYVPILNHFNWAIANNQRPITDFRNSIVSLNSIFKTYRDFPISTNTKEVYKK